MVRSVLAAAVAAAMVGTLAAPAHASPGDPRSWNVAARSNCSTVPDEVTMMAGPVRGTQQTTVVKVQTELMAGGDATVDQIWPAPSGWSRVGNQFTYTATSAARVRGGTVNGFAQSGLDAELGQVACSVALFRGRRTIAASTSRALVSLVLGAHPYLVFELRGVRKGHRYELGGYLVTHRDFHPNPRSSEFDLVGRASRSGVGVWRWAPKGLRAFTSIEWYLPHGRGDDAPVLAMERLSQPVTMPVPPAG